MPVFIRVIAARYGFATQDAVAMQCAVRGAFVPECHDSYQSKIYKEYPMGTILLIILVLVLIGALPTWPHSKNWGYAPSGLAGLIVVVLLIMLLTGRL